MSKLRTEVCVSVCFCALAWINAEGRAQVGMYRQGIVVEGTLRLRGYGKKDKERDPEACSPDATGERLAKGGGAERSQGVPVRVEYCESCTVPLEYCEFFDCQRATLARAEEATASDLNLANLTLSDSSKKKEGAKKSKKAKPAVQIKLTKRGKRKFVTTITGLESYLAREQSLKEAATSFSHSFACGASVVKGTDGKPDAIVIQGDVLQEAADMCTARFRVPSAVVKTDDSCRA